MNTFFRKIIVFKLRVAVRILLWRKKPGVIAITGSAGKTSTKEFLKQLLSIDYNVLAPEEGYNTEIGAPLSLFGEKVPTKLFSLREWSKIIFRVYGKALFARHYPEKVIVEMGADKPGDIKYLCSIFKPEKGVVLSVLPVHLEEFKNAEAIYKEKSELPKFLSENQKLFLNYDDEKVREMRGATKGRVIYFGTKNTDGYKALDVESDLDGLRFTLENKGEKINIETKLFGKHMIYPLLAAIAVSIEEGTSIKRLIEEIEDLKPFKGRMNIIQGIKGSIVIDDSYNANPESMTRALEFLEDQKGRKIAALGTMNELGDYEKDGHEIVGKKAAAISDIIITVGEPAEKYLVPSVLKEGFKKENIKSFDDSNKAGEYLLGIVKEGDVILAKGSQNKVRMEKLIKKIMADPKQASSILVRQSEFWQE